MTQLLLILALALPFVTPPAPAAVARSGKQYYKIHLGCWGATIDGWASVSGFSCDDGRGHYYYGWTAGFGWGGLLTLNYFHMEARLEKGRKLPGVYYGPSTSWALGLGGELAYFTRGARESWLPDLQADEYILLIGGHLGGAADVTMNTVHIYAR